MDGACFEVTMTLETDFVSTVLSSATRMPLWNHVNNGMHDYWTLLTPSPLATRFCTLTIMWTRKDPINETLKLMDASARALYPLHAHQSSICVLKS